MCLCMRAAYSRLLSAEFFFLLSSVCPVFFECPFVFRTYLPRSIWCVLELELMALPFVCVDEIGGCFNRNVKEIENKIFFLKIFVRDLCALIHTLVHGFWRKRGQKECGREFFIESPIYIISSAYS